jgi:hypothetical protein
VPEPESQDPAPEASILARYAPWGLLAVAGLAFTCAIGHAIAPARFDEKTALFLALAMVALVINRLTRFRGGGIEIDLTELKQEVENVQASLGGIEKSLAPASRSSSLAPAPVQETAVDAGIDPDDPNRGQFGNQSEANGRKLTAAIEPLAGPRSAFCSIRFRVESTDATKPLSGRVEVYTHPTFRRYAKHSLDVVNGVATDRRKAYGVFTIGIVADEGKTRLELNLANVPGGTKLFYAG